MTPPLPPPVLRFQKLYDELSHSTIGLCDGVYGADIHFTDPAHEIRGRDELKKYLARLYEGVAECRFDWLATVAQGDQAVVTWVLHTTHKRFRPGIPVSVPGCSHIRWDEQGMVVWHRDYFDMGALIYERIPVLGRLISRIRENL
jgi:limonene-1,2-epoxide hydrolase